jgi:hypothetical protein
LGPWAWPSAKLKVKYKKNEKNEKREEKKLKKSS